MLAGAASGTPREDGVSPLFGARVRGRSLAAQQALEVGTLDAQLTAGAVTTELALVHPETDRSWRHLGDGGGAADREVLVGNRTPGTQLLADDLAHDFEEKCAERGLVEHQMPPDFRALMSTVARKDAFEVIANLSLVAF